MTFEEFVNLSDVDRVEWNFGRLTWRQKLMLKAWFEIRKCSPHVRAVDLWESMMKGRF